MTKLHLNRSNSFLVANFSLVSLLFLSFGENWLTRISRLMSSLLVCLIVITLSGFYCVPASLPPSLSLSVPFLQTSYYFLLSHSLSLIHTTLSLSLSLSIPLSIYPIQYPCFFSLSLLSLSLSLSLSPSLSLSLTSLLLHKLSLIHSPATSSFTSLSVSFFTLY